MERMFEEKFTHAFETQRDRVISNITSSIDQSITEFNESVNDGIDKIQNATESFIEETQAGIEKGINEVFDDIYDLFGLDQSEEDEQDIALMATISEPEQSLSNFAIAASFGVASAVSLLLARKKCRKDDEDFVRA